MPQTSSLAVLPSSNVQHHCGIKVFLIFCMKQSKEEDFHVCLKDSSPPLCIIKQVFQHLKVIVSAGSHLYYGVAVKFAN